MGCLVFDRRIRTFGCFAKYGQRDCFPNKCIFSMFLPSKGVVQASVMIHGVGCGMTLDSKADVSRISVVDLSLPKVSVTADDAYNGFWKSIMIATSHLTSRLCRSIYDMKNTLA